MAMLPFFPSLLPDELLYSAIARLRERLRVPEHHAFEALLLGDSQATAVVDLPASVSRLLPRIPGRQALSADDLLWKHTLLPLHTAFVTAERARAALDALLMGTGQGVHRLLNANARMPPTPPSMQFCPGCLSQDMADHGEPYWHRIHQAPGVTCCPIHGRSLRRSMLQRTRRPNRHVFLTAAAACRNGSSELQCALPPRERHRAAQDLLWLLETPTLGWQTGALAGAYRELAVAAGYGRESGQLALTRLEADIVRHYGKASLTSLGIPFQQHRKSRSWIVRLLRGDPTSFSALQHHLVLRFLGSSVPRFITAASSTSVTAPVPGALQVISPEAN